MISIMMKEAMEIKKMLTEASIGIWFLASTSAYGHGREKRKQLNVTCKAEHERGEKRRKEKLLISSL